MNTMKAHGRMKTMTAKELLTSWEAAQRNSVIDAKTRNRIFSGGLRRQVSVFFKTLRKNTKLQVTS